MCGIIGYTGKKLAHPILFAGLKRLEYRGYDSYGFAMVADNPGMLVETAVGQIGNAKVDIKTNTFTGIAHTRWATHGRVNTKNAHPQLSGDLKIAVVHNGILTNYLELQDYLRQRGHNFRSETDTETIPRLIEEFMKSEGKSVLEALQATIHMIDKEGGYAFAMVHEDHPNEIFFAKNRAPLLIGIGEDENFVGSAEIAFLEHTKKFFPLEDQMFGRITPQIVEIYELESGKLVSLEGRITISQWNLEEAQKGGFSHFMLKEIHDQPHALRNTLLSMQNKELQQLAQRIVDRPQPFLVAAGTSWHSCLVGELLLEQFAQIRARAILPNNLASKKLNTSDLVIAVSQSGETADTIAAMRHAKSNGAAITCIVNNLASEISRISELSVYTHAGPEIGVAATKTFTTQILAFTRLAITVGKLNGSISEERYQSLLQDMTQLPDLVSTVIKRSEYTIRNLAKRIRYKASMYFLGSASTLPIALEGALKIKEIAYLHAEGYNAAESKHGPIALIEPEFPVLFIGAHDRTRYHLLGNIREMSARGAYTIVVHESGSDNIAAAADLAIALPDLPCSEFIYIPASVVLQLLAYYTAVNKKIDGKPINPDMPRSLAKSVTVV